MKYVSIALLLIVSPAHADELSDKKCALSSSILLPQIPGLTISTSRISEASKSETALKFAQKHSTSESDAIGTAQAFGFLDATTDNILRNFFQSGNYSLIGNTMKQGIEGHLSSSSRVEIDINAVGYTATYAFYCGITPSGEAIALPLGLIR